MKIYTEDFNPVNKSKYVYLLHPHFGIETHKTRFPKLHNGFNKLFQITSLEDCDVAIYPLWFQGKDMPRLKEFANRVKAAGKRTIALSVSDNPKSPKDTSNSRNTEGVIMFRTSTFLSDRKQNVHTMPGMRQNQIKELENYGHQYSLRQKNKIPTLGFCGQVLSNKFRSRAVAAAKKGNINTNFAIIPGFWGQINSNKIKRRTKEYHGVRKRFLLNMHNSDYALCCRGVGNFSYRLYEALSMGRIPVFINTDSLMPHHDMIKWKNFVCWVEPKQVDKIDKVILDYHSKLTPKQFQQKQINCRNLWREWLSSYGFASQLHKYL